MKKILFCLFLTIFSISCWPNPKFFLTEWNKKASHEKIGKINVLNLYGTREEIAYQHGVFAKELIQTNKSSLNHYFHLIKNSILNATESSFTGQLYAKYVDTILTSEYISNSIPGRDQGVYGAFAAGAGLENADEVFKAALFPDIGQYLLGKDSESEYFDFIQHLPTYGCTSLIAKSSTDSSNEIIARNFDFSSFGAYENNAAIIFIHPSEAQDQQYVMFTSLGLHSSHTTWNESGLFLSLHQLMVNDNKSSGTYILGITDEISRRAHNLDEVKKIIESHGITSSWRIIVHSTKEHKTLLADVSASKKALKLIDEPIHFFTNHVFDKELSQKQFFPYYNYGWDSLQRFNYLKTKTQNLTDLSVLQVTNLISSHEYIHSDNQLSQRHIGTIAKQSNLMSLVIDSATNTVFFAVPNNEFESSPSGTYQAIPLDFSMKWLSHQVNQQPLNSIKSEFNNKIDQNFITAEANMRKAEFMYESQAPMDQYFPFIKTAFEHSNLDLNISLVKAGMELKQYGRDNRKQDLLQSAKVTLESLIQKYNQTDKDKHPLLIANLLLARTYVLTGDLNAASSILNNWTGNTSLYLNENVKLDSNFLKQNIENSDKLKNYFNETIKRLTFEISDTDVSTF